MIPSPEALRSDVVGEPQALRAVCEHYGAGGGGRFALEEIGDPSRVLLTGMGSSFSAARDCSLRLRSIGVDSHAELASTGLPQPPGPGTLCVLISASGSSLETAARLRDHSGCSTTVAISAAAAPFAEDVDHVLPIPTPRLLSETALQTFQSTLAVLRLLSAWIAGESIDDVLTQIELAAFKLESLIESSPDWLPGLADSLEDSPVFIAAPAHRMASARQGALVLREVPRIIAQECEVGDWSHVDVYLSARPGYQLLLLDGSDWSAELVSWMGSRNRRLIELAEVVPEIGGASPVDEALAAAVETAIFELLACEMLVRRQAEGLTFDSEVLSG